MAVFAQSSVDGGAWKQTDTFTKWSLGLHLPWAIMLEDGLAFGHHTMRVRIAANHNQKSTGTTLRVMHLLLN
jgi:sialidase-1